MKIVHRIGDSEVSREVNKSTPISFSLSDKKGGQFLLDSCSGRYVAKVGGELQTVLKVFLDGVNKITNEIFRLNVDAEEGSHSFFVPFYSRALAISGDDTPLVMELPGKYNFCEESGVLTIESKKKDSNVMIVIMGEGISYEKKYEDRNLILTLSSKRIVISVGEDEKALEGAVNLYKRQNELEEMQKKYVYPAPGVSSNGCSENDILRSCIMNGIDNMFIFDKGILSPIEGLSQVTPVHESLGAQAFLMEGEVSAVKDVLMNNLADPSFAKSAWPMLVLGKMLNKLSAEKRLFHYFSIEELKGMGSMLSVKLDSEESESVEMAALRLLSHRLAHALTKNEIFSRKEKELLPSVRERFEKIVDYSLKDTRLRKSAVNSIFLTAYVYPHLYDKDGWKMHLDPIVERMGNMKSMRRMTSELDRCDLSLELFGTISLVGTVLSRIDSHYYGNHIAEAKTALTRESLYKGLIGRPTMNYKLEMDPLQGSLFKDNHVLNNTLFLDFLQESR